MTPNIKPECVARSVALGFFTLFFSTSLVACGPGPEKSSAPDHQSFAQREPTFELAPDERENGPISPTQRKSSNDLLDH